jgi:hypothetical protein
MADGDGSPTGKQKEVAGEGTVEEEDDSSRLCPLSLDKIRWARVGPTHQLTSVDGREPSGATSSLQVRPACQKRC